jgi:NitT/TauT family transport system ATP-binding protein
MAIRIDSLSKCFGTLQVFDNLSLGLEEGRITALLGPSGCGKTTLLNLLARILLPDSGTIEGLEGRRISYLFQEPRLLPWETAEDNIRFVLDGKMGREEGEARLDKFLGLTDLEEFRGFYPYQMSGGMRQRLAIARAFAYPSEVLLMDEPFQGLDLPRKLDLISSFVRLWAAERRTTIFVTHDVQEALVLGDEIVLFSGPPAKPREVFGNPAGISERNLENPELIELEKRLYVSLLGSGRAPLT